MASTGSHKPSANRAMKAGGVAGLLIGALACYPVVTDSSPPCFGFPGMLAAIVGGKVEEAYRWHAVSLATIALYCLGNLAFYGVLGACLGSAYARRSAARPPQRDSIPRCLICGFKWPSPTDEHCPECGELSFLGADEVAGRKVKCNSCGYDLRGTRSGVCPECGQVY